VRVSLRPVASASQRRAASWRGGIDAALTMVGLVLRYLDVVSHHTNRCTLERAGGLLRTRQPQHRREKWGRVPRECSMGEQPQVSASSAGQRRAIRTVLCSFPHRIFRRSSCVSCRRVWRVRAHRGVRVRGASASATGGGVSRCRSVRCAQLSSSRRGAADSACAHALRVACSMRLCVCVSALSNGRLRPVAYACAGVRGGAVCCRCAVRLPTPLDGSSALRQTTRAGRRQASGE